MKFIVITAALIGFAAAGSIEFCDAETCTTGSCSVQSPGREGVECRELGGIKSAFVMSVDDGCSFTVYSDPSCSDLATTVPLNECAQFGPGLKSFSYDC